MREAQVRNRRRCRSPYIEDPACDKTMLTTTALGTDFPLAVFLPMRRTPHTLTVRLLVTDSANGPYMTPKQS